MTSSRLLWSFASCLWASAAVAQTVVPPQADISRQRVTPLPLPDPGVDLRILNPERTEVPRAVDELAFAIKKIAVSGATLVSDAELAAIFGPLEGRRIVLDDLRRAAEALEARYRSRGYFQTRVFVPPQAVRDGTLEVRVVEGYIGEVTVQAPNAASRRLGAGRMGPITQRRPVRLVDLETPLLLLNDVPGVQATGVLKPGVSVGTSELLLNVERRPSQSYVGVSNFAPDTVGPMTLTAGTSLSQPFGGPGSLDLSVNIAGERAEELQAVSARYAMPLGTRGIIASLGLVVARAAPGAEVADLGIKSRSTSGTVRVRFPLVRQRAHALYLDLGLTLNRSRVSALDEPITKDRSTVADVAVAWRQVGWLGGDMTARIGVAQGLLLFGANNSSAPLPSVFGFSPQFTRLTYSLQRNQPVHGNLSAGLTILGQHTRSRLLSGEQVMFGGNLIGRGYDPSQLIGDRGIGVLGEMRLNVPAWSTRGRLENVQLFLFGDWAEARVNPLPGQDGVVGRLASLGGGVRALVLKRLFVDAHVASARRRLSPLVPRGERVNVTATLLF